MFTLLCLSFLFGDLMVSLGLPRKSSFCFFLGGLQMAISIHTLLTQLCYLLHSSSDILHTFYADTLYVKKTRPIVDCNTIFWSNTTIITMHAR